MFAIHIQVLAHRGGYWALLQNGARALWNSVHTALLRAYTPTLVDEDNGLLTIDEIRSMAWKPLHVAADCMLDMMAQLQVDLQAQTAKVIISGAFSPYISGTDKCYHFHL